MRFGRKADKHSCFGNSTLNSTLNLLTRSPKINCCVLKLGIENLEELKPPLAALEYGGIFWGLVAF